MLKVTCAILCYNYGHYLSLAIDSCLNQDKGDYETEVIVIDDGSTDNTPDVCKTYAGKIKYIRSENEGFGASLTKAVTYATGEIICLLDADDYFLHGKLNVIVKEFSYRKELLFLYHDLAIIDEEGNITKTYCKGGNTSTQVFRKDAALSLLPAYNEQFFSTLYMVGHGHHLKKKLSHYRTHNSSMSNPKNLYTWKKELVKMNVLHLAKLKELIRHPPYWAKAEKLKKTYAEIASSYNYLLMEIALNSNNNHLALRRYLLMLYWDLRSEKIRISNIKYLLTYFFLKRYVKYQAG